VLSAKARKRSDARAKEKSLREGSCWHGRSVAWKKGGRGRVKTLSSKVGGKKAVLRRRRQRGPRASHQSLEARGTRRKIKNFREQEILESKREMACSGGYRGRYQERRHDEKNVSRNVVKKFWLEKRGLKAQGWLPPGSS